MSSPYELALKDPRWKAKRMEIIAAHGYRCDDCRVRMSRSVVLNVHHRRYQNWDAPWLCSEKDCDVLCLYCHERRHRPPCHMPQQIMLFANDEIARLMARRARNSPPPSQQREEDKEDAA